VNPAGPMLVPMVVQRPHTWAELGWAFIAGIGTALFAYGLGVMFGAATAHAGGPTVVSWNQATDCASVTAWELLAAPITSANPNPQPTTAAVGVTITNTGSPCGLNMTRTVDVSGVGPMRFWLRAVAGSTRSGTSNAVDQSLPLGKPDGLTVSVP
jgi:hypothetical protein